MEVIADSGAIYAIYDRADEHHKTISSFLRSYTPTILLPSPLLGELGYMLAEWLGEAAVLQFLSDLEDGVYTLVDPSFKDIQLARIVLAKHARLKLGLCDAWVAAAAQRLNINQLMTVDRKHFRVVKNSKGKPFQLMPWDLAQ